MIKAQTPNSLPPDGIFDCPLYAGQPEDDGGAWNAYAGKLDGPANRASYRPKSEGRTPFLPVKPHHPTTTGDSEDGMF